MRDYPDPGKKLHDLMRPHWRPMRRWAWLRDPENIVRIGVPAAFFGFYLGWALTEWLG